MNFSLTIHKLIWCIVFCIIVSLSLDAQERFYREGARYFENKCYTEALEQFALDKYSDKNKDLLMKRMIANYEVNNIEKAKADVPKVLAFEQIPDLVYLYIAKIYHAELNFEKAIEYYKNYLRKTGKGDQYRQMVIGEIKRCAVGLNLQFYEQSAFVENMGSEINTPYDEMDPVQSPNYLAKYYFSSNRPDSEGGKRNSKGIKDEKYGDYFLDMYSAELFNGRWSDIKPLNTLLNTSKHERVLDFNTNGSILFFMKGESPTTASIHVDTFGVQKSEIYPPKLKSPVYGEKGDVYLQFYNDSTVIFASKRTGGYGGYDLYVSYMKEDLWSQPKNLGPRINTPYDEISPFLTNDGRHLYFSSNGLESIGGFDVFHSEYLSDAGTWSSPTNMKLGINSALDDIHYRISADGQSAYFCSSRKSGYGRHDLYTAYLKKQEIGQLAYNPVLPFIADDVFIKDLVSSRRIRRPSAGTRATPQSENTKPDTPDDIRTVTEREYVVDPLNYTSDENLFTIKNQKTLDNIVDIMNIYPSTRIQIESHSVPESQIAYELYFSLKRAEKISEYLIDKGVRRSRILLRGFGASYPLVSREKAGPSSALAGKLNRRLEVRVLGAEDLPLKIDYTEPVIADFLKDQSSELYKTILSGLSYRVEIARVRQMYQNEILNYYQDAMIEKGFDDDDYIYSIGLYKSYFDAQDVLKALRNDNITTAVIKPFLDGKEIDSDSLMDLATKYPDLVNYLQYNGQ